MNVLMKHLTLVFTTLLIFISYNVQAASSYEMPVGIPNTTLDFQQEMPLRPSDWSVEKTGYYYINYQTGSDKQTYGTPAAPRKSFPTPALAGSYIEIAGEYTQGFTGNGNRMYTFNGTDAEWNAGVAGPVWVTGAKDTYGAISRVGFQMQGGNIFISDIDLINGAKLQVGSPTEGRAVENVVMRNLDITGGNIAISGYKGNTTRAENIVIFNSKIHDLGNVDSLTDDDQTLIQITAGVSDVWILENKLYEANGTGLQILGDKARATTRNIYAGNNEVYRTKQSGLWVKYGSNVVFSTNRVRDIIGPTWSPAKGIGAQYAPDNYWIINNHISGVEYGIRIASTDTTTWDKKIYAIGNIIHNIRPFRGGPDTIGPIDTTSSWQSAGIHVASGDEFYAYNNLIFDAPNGITASTQNISMWIKNNILLDVTGGHENEPAGYHIMLEYLTLNEKAIIENNYFGAGMYVYTKAEGLKLQDYSVTALNARAGASGNIQGTNIITPNNIDSIMDTMTIDGMGFTQLKDAGTNVDDILTTRFTSLFPGTIGINSDIFGKQLSFGGSIDIGPFEQDGAEVDTTNSIIPDSTTIPTKPGGVTVIQIPYGSELTESISTE